MSQSIHVAAILLLAVPAMGCVSANHFKAAATEADRLRRENFELRKTLAEARVRAEEAMEVASGSAGPETRSSVAQPAVTSQGSAPAPAMAPEGLVGPAASITDEDVHAPAEASEPDKGADGLLKAARKYRGAGRPREAADIYTRLISDFPFSPRLPEAFLERADSRLAVGDRKGALEDFDTVAEAFPASASAQAARRQAALLRR